MMSTPSLPETNLKKRILHRVYWLWFLRRVAPIVAVELALVSGAAIGVLAHISPRAILLNALQASSGIGSFIQFFIDNFFVKSVQSRLLFTLWLGFLVYLLRDIRGIRRRLQGMGEEAFVLSSSLGGNRR